jgi:hypothetical protein
MYRDPQQFYYGEPLEWIRFKVGYQCQIDEWNLCRFSITDIWPH